jgi:DNA repair/transcription protein MET18/MMS19
MADVQPSRGDEVTQAHEAIEGFIGGDALPSNASLVDAELSEEIVRPWQSGQRKLVEAVKMLGPHLTSDNEQIRLRAVTLLSLLVIKLANGQDAAIKQKTFDKQAITTFAAFFAQKIEDGNTVAGNIAQSLNASTPLEPESAPEARKRKYPIGSEMLVSSIKALYELSKMDGFASEAAKLTADSLVKHSSPRVHPQAIRFLIYTLMDSLLSRHRMALKQLGQEFVNGYIELIEGEKDPRNLVYIFAMDRVILIEWDTLEAESVENFFDCTYCYFPITFRPPPDDPYGISTNSLRLALRRVLSATPLFAPHALPLLIEKMQASGGNAKRDTLDTFADALPVFGRSAALAHARELWQGFRIEIMHATDEATAVCATRALESLLYVLYVGEEQAEGLAPEIVADMLDELEEPSKQQAKPASTIIGAMIRASSATSQLAIQATVDHLLSMYKQTDNFTFRPAILDHLSTLIRAVQETYISITSQSDKPPHHDSEEGKFTFVKPASSVEDDQQAIKRAQIAEERSYEADCRPLDGFRDLVISTVSHAIATTTTRSAGIELFVRLSHVNLLTAAEMRHLCTSVNDLLLDSGSEDIRTQAVEGLHDLANQRVVEETTLPLLFNALPDRIEDSDEGLPKQKNVIRSILGALARLCNSAEFFELLVVRLTTKLDLLCALGVGSMSEEQRKMAIGYARGLCSTLIYVTQDKLSLKHPDLSKYGANLVPRLLGMLVEASLRDDAFVGRDKNVIRDASALIMLLVQCMDGKSKHEVLANVLYTLVFDGSLQRLAAAGSIALSRAIEAAPEKAKIDLLSEHATVSQRNVFYAVSHALVALNRTAPNALQDARANDEVAKLLTWTLDGRNGLQEEAGCDLLANWLNKYVAEPCPEAVKDTLERFWDAEIGKVHGPDDMQVDQSANDQRRRQRAVRVWLSVSRAFLVKNSKQAEGMVKKVIDILSDEKAGEGVLNESARRIGSLLREDNVLCKANDTIIRLLFKQRFVTFILPKLLDGHKRSQSASKQLQNVHLIAICSLLPNLPRAMLMDKLKDLFPLLILALDIADDGVVQSSAAQVITLAATSGRRLRDEAILNGKAATALGHAPSQAAIDNASGRNSLDLVQEHLNAIVKRILAIVVIQSKANPSTKIAALRCLGAIAATVEYTSLHPHKAAVLRALGNHRGQGIDDARRDVRLEAVDCRDAWFRLKGEGEEETD